MVDRRALNNDHEPAAKPAPEGPGAEKPGASAVVKEGPLGADRPEVSDLSGFAPKGDPTNPERAAFAEKVLRAFDAETGRNLDEDPETVLSDLLADLQHYARLKGVDFDQALETAQSNFEAEVQEETEMAPEEPAPEPRGVYDPGGEWQSWHTGGGCTALAVEAEHGSFYCLVTEYDESFSPERPDQPSWMGMMKPGGEPVVSYSLLYQGTAEACVKEGSELMAIVRGFRNEAGGIDNEAANAWLEAELPNRAGWEMAIGQAVPKPGKDAIGTLTVIESSFAKGQKAVAIATNDDTMCIHDPFSSVCGRFRAEPAELGLNRDMVQAWWDKVQELEWAGEWDRMCVLSNDEVEDWLQGKGLPQDKMST